MGQRPHVAKRYGCLPLRDLLNAHKMIAKQPGVKKPLAGLVRLRVAVALFLLTLLYIV